MNEYLTSFLVIFSEVGMLLALIGIVVGFLMVRRRQRHRSEARHFVAELRDTEPSRKHQIKEVLEKVHHLEPDAAEKTTETMVNSEKRIYNRVLKIFLGDCHKESLEMLRKDVENMAKAYQRFVDAAPAGEAAPRGDNPMQAAAMRKQIKQLEKEKEKLETDLAEAMTSMENIMKEYTQMYSGGAKKEGVKHIENELTQLKDRIAKNVVGKVDEEETGEPSDDQAEANNSQQQDVTELKPEVPPDSQQDK
jgi:uncharacterized membrane-anchored protein YhcB (DUF1043 family)